MSTIDCNFSANWAHEVSGLLAPNRNEGTALYVAGSVVSLKGCRFTSSQNGSTTVHVNGGKLRLEGLTEFGSPSSTNTAIRVESALASSVQMTNARLLFPDSTHVSLAGEFDSTDSSIEFGQADTPSTFLIETDSKIEWKGMQFEGDGNITVATGVIMAEVTSVPSLRIRTSLHIHTYAPARMQSMHRTYVCMCSSGVCILYWRRCPALLPRHYKDYNT